MHKIAAATLSLALTLGLGSVPALAGEEARQPPPTRSSDVLTEQVFRSISVIQEMMNPEDPNTPADMEGAKRELDDLYQRRYERMNDFEKSTVLNFYTNYYLATDNIPEALRIFEQMLTIENLREDTRLRALRALGQLNMAEENFENAIRYYNEWRELSLDEDETVFLGLANSHYSLSQFAEAVPYMLNHMEMLAENGETIERNKWGLLNVLYIEQEDYASALEIIKNMVVLFDDPSDWRNLSAIYSYLDQDANRIGALGMAYLKGYMENDAEFLNLGQSLAGEETPYTGAKIIIDGMEKGAVARDEDNLKIVVQMLQLANEFDEAVPYATELAEVTENGDGFDTLGYIQYVLHNYEAAAEAFRNAISKGNLSNEADTQLFLSRALVELDEYDAALTAARRSSDLGSESERRAAQSYVRFIEGQKARFEAIERRKADVLDFYVSYD
jgi:tetratricopeptide (TPR) repeat protein